MCPRKEKKVAVMLMVREQEGEKRSRKKRRVDENVSRVRTDTHIRRTQEEGGEGKVTISFKKLPILMYVFRLAYMNKPL